MSNTSNWKRILSKDQIKLINWKLATHINKRFKGQKIIVACILKGAIYFHAHLTELLTVEHSQYFIEASSYHDAQTQSDQIEILSQIVPSKFAGRKVILLDELYDNGTTLNNVKKKISELAFVDPNDIFTCTIFKKDKETDQPDPDLFGILVPNVWLVGYGLDNKQEMRNWTDLWAVPKADNIAPTEDDKLFTDCDFYNGITARIINDLSDIPKGFTLGEATIMVKIANDLGIVPNSYVLPEDIFIVQ